VPSTAGGVQSSQAEPIPFVALLISALSMAVWTVSCEAQNRPLRVTITYDVATGQEVSRRRFADQHILDRIVGYGVAWHEGQLFGWINQLIGVLTAIGLIVIAASGFILWRRRKPEDALGAPPLPKVAGHRSGIAMILLVLAVFLPVLAISLVGLGLFERTLRAHLPGMARWLGMSPRGTLS
jgi:uncharacterized iron-regulated membrane protein